MRVRQFELRLLAVAITVLWAAVGGMVLIAYRPGGPVDLLVGIAASMPLLVSVAAIVWPPLVRSDRGSAGVFWLGLVAGLLLVPSIAGVAGQVIAGGTQPLLPSVEAIYPWALALLATSLFAGLGISRQVINEIGIGKRRMAASAAFALAATSLIGGIFAGVTLADEAALRDRPAAYSRFGPTAVDLLPPECNKTLVGATTARFELDLWADVDTRSVGTVNLAGSRSGTDLSWTAQVVRGSDLFVKYGAARQGSAAWLLVPGGAWTPASSGEMAPYMVDATVLAEALSLGNRATAENLGFEYVEGARARHCRIAVDGTEFRASFPQVVWLVEAADISTWRGELDFWVFGDGEVGRIEGRVNGNAQEILPHGLLATVNVRMTATDRDTPISVPAPRT